MDHKGANIADHAGIYVHARGLCLYQQMKENENKPCTFHTCGNFHLDKAMECDDIMYQESEKKREKINRIK